MDAIHGMPILHLAKCDLHFEVLITGGLTSQVIARQCDGTGYCGSGWAGLRGPIIQ